jgi:uncharacterized protein (DUF1684 family)
MTLNHLTQQIERLRASGVHPLTDVEIADGSSFFDVGSIIYERGRVVIKTDYGADLTQIDSAEAEKLRAASDNADTQPAERPTYQTSRKEAQP